MELVSLLNTELVKKSDNLYLTEAYTSAAGNSYYSSILVASGLVLKEDIGVGYLYTFLNHLEIYSLKDKTLIADKSYHSVCYSKLTVIQEVTSMLMGVFKNALVKKRLPINLKELESQVRKIASDLYEAKNPKEI